MNLNETIWVDVNWILQAVVLGSYSEHGNKDGVHLILLSR
jgi:hypothetical protein